MSDIYMKNMLSVAQWEKAKGELRALVQMHGSMPAHSNPHFKKIKQEVEGFISAIEEDGIHQITEDWID